MALLLWQMIWLLKGITTRGSHAITNQRGWQIPGVIFGRYIKKTDRLDFYSNQSRL